METSCADTKRSLGITAMPSLFRFLFVVGLLAAITVGGLYVLAAFFEPEPKEITQPVPGVKVRR
jgi:hypothetical protein